MSLKTQIQQRKLRKAKELLDENIREAIASYVKALLGAEKRKDDLKIQAMYAKKAQELSDIAQKLSDNLSYQSEDEQINLKNLYKTLGIAVQNLDTRYDEHKKELNKAINDAYTQLKREESAILEKAEQIRPLTFSDLTEKEKKELKGKDGSPDTPEDIAMKLNKTKESINISVIKGLSEKFDIIKKSIRGGKNGGGMGNPQQEVFNLTPATTTITTTYPIAANGTAIFNAYWQGQALVRGFSYTVGSNNKTLTLLFTPVDGTFLDITYVRG